MNSAGLAPTWGLGPPGSVALRKIARGGVALARDVRVTLPRTLLCWLWLAALTPNLAVAQSAPYCPPEPSPPSTARDALSATRVLRRVSLVLTGRTPTVEAYEAMLAAPEAEREVLLGAAIDAALSSPEFYERLLDFAHRWITVGAYTTGAIGDAYQGDMAGHLFRCDGAVHPGAFVHHEQVNTACDDPAALVRQIEPWWAPGTTVTVVGDAASDTVTVPDPRDASRNLDCGIAEGGYYDPSLPAGCGCGPNLIWCAPISGLGGGSTHDPAGQRRQPYEEPARLFAHLVWHDRPLSDLVTGNYSVANNPLRALYVRLGRMTGSDRLDRDPSWWQPSTDPSPRDPQHPAPNDPLAWREFVVESLNPYFLALSPNSAPSGSLDRTYRYDPTTTTDPPDGIPAAGVLTMLGSYSSFARERVRAARFLEIFACMNFAPPSADQTFPDYDGDPATSGTCLHCHRAIDPVAIHFRRWDFHPGLSYYVPWPFLPGVGRFRITPEQLSGNYPYSSGPWARWKDAFRPGTIMTPVSEAQIAANPEALFLDTMPADYQIFGQSGDGTMGPLGFGKILVRSGEFDRCVVQKLYDGFVGRPLDPAGEARYIDALAERFRAGDRQVKPFLRYLFTLPELRRGL